MERIARIIIAPLRPFRLMVDVYDKFCDCLKFIIGSIWKSFVFIFKFIFEYSSKLLGKVYSLLPFKDELKKADYERLGKTLVPYVGPLPYRNDALRRRLTYWGGLVLGVVLFVFVYLVLVKHHSYVSVLIAGLLFCAYVVVLEGSHNIRSIMMLCLPIMFTNRGRALIFCCMLAITVAGPVKNSQTNISALHKSLNCGRSYLIIEADKYVDESVVHGAVKVEDLARKIINEVKTFVADLRAKFELILKLAITVERYIATALAKLKEIVNVCNRHTGETYDSCISTFRNAFVDCTNKLGPLKQFCEVVRPLDSLCSLVRLPDKLCVIPAKLIAFLDETIGRRLHAFMLIIENEFYVDVDVDYKYSYEGTKSKKYATSYREIKEDIENKFWFIRTVLRVFNFVTLILVIWILITATLYHMHFLTETSYDNMYLDGYLTEIEERRKRRRQRGANSESENDEGEQALLIADRQSDSDFSDAEAEVPDEGQYLFPMTREHEKEYLKPFSFSMNHVEKHKLQIAGLVWLVIMIYIGFFLLLDFSMYKIIGLIEEILNEILFKGDLPLVDITSKSGDSIIRYNRTYLEQLNLKTLKEAALFDLRVNSTSSIHNLYRKMMNSIEKDLPDDVKILNSLTRCLPKYSTPNFVNYRRLLVLAIVTLIAVFLEAYALRTRHCIANLYYPKLAKKRALWLYMKLVKEKPKFESADRLIEKEDHRQDWLEKGAEFLAERIKNRQ